MNKTLRVIITFIISFVISYIIVGYIINGIFVMTRWAEDATVWHKLREYYIRTASTNILPAFIIAIIPTTIVALSKNK
jgi:hypothetical protein